MGDDRYYPRKIQPGLEEALTDTPVVLIHGARQSGKTTLAKMVGDRRGYRYITFDDDVQLAAALSDPVGFIGDLPEKCILDEVQRAPTLFSAIKGSIDRNRTPGRFIFTGSANVLLIPKLADSLAGRMEILRLYPLAQSELARSPATFLESLFSRSFKARQWKRLGPALAEKIVAGGYPSALERESPKRRAAWYRDYAETIVQRDVRNLARISAMEALPRLLQLAAGQTASLVNIAGLSLPFQLSRPTVRDYVTLLERVFLLELIPPWHSNRLSRLVKTAKLHLGDTGLAAALLGLDARGLAKDRKAFGRLLETFVLQEIRRQASWAGDHIALFHFRDRDGAEVDIVLERGAVEVAGVEVKAAATVTLADFRGLRKLREAAGERFVAGVVLYDGEVTVSFGGGFFAVPIRSLWESL